ncbi:MAG TPA: TlpA disulfide reductase family protein [Pyrinomonadaceae bacterium]|nr:TlpA disulfide reductase family protein [Pyrinomonadaceae bacterium]
MTEATDEVGALGRARSVTELEGALREMRATPYEVPFQARVELALRLAEGYLSVDDAARARAMLIEETALAEEIFQAVQLTGTPAQKRAAAGGRVQLIDRVRQVELLDKEAPEPSVKTWLQGEATTLSALRGRVVLLEFWATWCGPCREMFAKLRRLDEEHRGRGLEIVAVTRHYFARAGDSLAKAEELELIRGVVNEQGLKFRVGVAEDDGAQALYGATGLPTLALIDRKGVVRYARSGGADARFERLFSHYLDE